MLYVNEAHLVGLVRDEPEQLMIYGKQAVRFTLVTRLYIDGVKTPFYHNVVAFNLRARHILSQYIHAGAHIAVRGFIYYFRTKDNDTVRASVCATQVYGQLKSKPEMEWNNTADREESSFNFEEEEEQGDNRQFLPLTPSVGKYEF